MSRSSRPAEYVFEQIALLGMSTSSDPTESGSRLTLGVLSPGDLQELLDVGDLLRLLFQIPTVAGSCPHVRSVASM